jgi:hypothetical protein
MTDDVAAHGMDSVVIGYQSGTNGAAAALTTSLSGKPAAAGGLCDAGFGEKNFT